MKLWHLLRDRVQEGALGNEAFNALLAQAAAEFKATAPKRKRGRPARETAGIELVGTEAALDELTGLRLAR